MTLFEAIQFSLTIWITTKVCDAVWKRWIKWLDDGKRARRRRGMRWDGPDLYHFEGDDENPKTPR